MEAGNWDLAYKHAESAMRRSFHKAAVSAKTPADRAVLEQAVKGTVMQADMASQIIGAARQQTIPKAAQQPRGTGGGPETATPRMTQAGAARAGHATVGPAGILDPGRMTRPLAATQRAHTLPRVVVQDLQNAIEKGLIHTVPGNKESRTLLYRQVTEQILLGRNTAAVKQYLNLSDEMLAQAYRETIQEAARMLQSLSALAQGNEDLFHEAAAKISFGGALSGSLKKASGGRIFKNAPEIPTDTLLARLVEDTSLFDRLMLLHSLAKPPKLGKFAALQNASYGFMLSQPATAVRNAISFVGRYSVDTLDEALTAGAHLAMGNRTKAAASMEQFKARGRAVVKGSALVTPRTSWKGTLQEIYDFTAGSLQQLKPSDARRTLALLNELPEREAHFLGTMMGEDLREGATTGVKLLDSMIDPKFQRILTTFNRAQEFSGRGMVFDGSVRAQLRSMGLDPNVLLMRPAKDIIQAVGGEQAFDDLIYAATTTALEATFSGQAAKQSIPGALLNFVNQVSIAKLGFPFPKFNLVAAPRWIYDHSPFALAEVFRTAADATGLTSGGFRGGRLTRGLRAQKIQEHDLPILMRERALTDKAYAENERLYTAAGLELGASNRQVKRLTRRAQEGLPGTQTALEQAQMRQASAQRQRDQLLGQRETLQGRLREIDKTEKFQRDIVRDAIGINAPNGAQYLARMASGMGLLGAAAVIRSMPQHEGTRWYEWKRTLDDGTTEIVDLRAYAPFAQYLFMADVMVDFDTHTNWDGYHEQIAEVEGVPGPLDMTRAMWDNYEGKYTAAELGSEFGKAFLSISRASGTTLTMTDLMTANGWPSLEDVSNAAIGTIGQFLSRFSTPARFAKDMVSTFDPEEAKLRTTPKPTADEPWHPMGAWLGNIPYASRVIPERISQTSGQPMTTAHPFLRAVLGVGTAPRDAVVEEIRKVGVPGQSVYIRETGDYGLDTEIARTYGQVLQSELPGFVEDEYYQMLDTPALKRDFLQQVVFPVLKRAALAEVKAAQGLERYEGATVRGENARRKRRQQRLIESLEQEAPVDESLYQAPADTRPGPPPQP